MSLGWAIAGIGSHADLKIAPAIARAQDSQLVAVYSRDQGRADDFAEKHGADAAYSTLDAMLADSRVDAVFVASPTRPRPLKPPPRASTCWPKNPWQTPSPPPPL